MLARRRLGRLAAALLACLLQACMAMPRTDEVYDKACGVYTHQMTLEVAQVASVSHCANDGCLAWLVAAGAVTAASVVVSGSIVVVGNIVYWAEKQGRCVRS